MADIAKEVGVSTVTVHNALAGNKGVSDEMREKIRKVMRFSGPRMLFYHPVLAVWHLVCSVKEK